MPVGRFRNSRGTRKPTSTCSPLTVTHNSSATSKEISFKWKLRSSRFRASWSN
ncbi:MAG: reeler domain-containing protein [Acidobacteriota bacterium]